MKPLSEIFTESKNMPRADLRGIREGEFVAYALADDAVLMRIFGRSNYLDAGRPGHVEKRLIARRVYIEQPGVARLGIFRLPLDHDSILARGDAAFELLELEKITRWISLSASTPNLRAPVGNLNPKRTRKGP